ncbi:MAG: FAD-binding protein, partial [Propionibacteriaceae bacterium]
MSTPHVVVIGSGLAGLTAAHRLMAGGARVTLVTKGLGGLQLSQGTIDVLGYAPGRVERPLESLASLPAEHPYRTIGAEAVATALGYLTDVVVDDLLAGEAAQNVWLPTAV